MVDDGTRNMGVADLPATFAAVAKQCRDLQPNLDWFVRGVFAQDEIDAFAAVMRYTALDRLHRSYSAVVADLRIAIDELRHLDAAISLRYQVALLGSTMDLTVSIPALPEVAFELPPMPPLAARHRREYEKLLANHGADMQNQAAAQTAMNVVAQLDLSLIREAIATASRSQALESTVRVQGGGGVVEGSICRKDALGLKADLFGRMVLAILFTGGCGWMVRMGAADAHLRWAREYRGNRGHIERFVRPPRTPGGGPKAAFQGLARRLAAPLATTVRPLGGEGRGGESKIQNSRTRMEAWGS